MNSSHGYDRMYGNIQKGRDSRRVTCEGCGRSYLTTYRGMYPCPKCGHITVQKEEEHQ